MYLPSSSKLVFALWNSSSLDSQLENVLELLWRGLLVTGRCSPEEPKTINLPLRLFNIIASLPDDDWLYFLRFLSFSNRIFNLSLNKLLLFVKTGDIDPLLFVLHESWVIIGMFNISGGVELTDSPIGDSLRCLGTLGCIRRGEVSFVLVCLCWKANRHLFNSLSILSSSCWLIGNFV